MDMSNLLLHAWICMWLFLPVTMLLTFQAGRFNAAIGKPTQQSSTYSSYASSRAVDGNDGSSIGTCTLTQSSYHTWWEVNLQAVYRVYSATLTNRGDCCGNRLRNFTIYGSNTGFDPTQVTDLMLCNSQTQAMANGETRTFYCGLGLNTFIDAQYIIVSKNNDYNDALTLCEVQVEADCLNNYYGQNCAENCNEHHCSAGTVCSKSDGICPQGCDPGYTGDACIDACADNYYGYPCQPCSENCLNSNCYKFTDTGYCVDDMCEPGYQYSKQCDTVCSNGSYGHNCLEACSQNCAAGTTCDKVNGQCSSCKSGYTGDLCHDICADGTYGDRCISTCSQNCQIPVCDKFSDLGRCEEPGCIAGFKGENCTTECPDYTYGISCMYDCSPYCVNPCDKSSETGSCGGECKPGYKGDNCTQNCVEEDECINNTEEQNGNEPTTPNTAVIIAVVVCTFVLSHHYYSRGLLL